MNPSKTVRTNTHSVKLQHTKSTKKSAVFLHTNNKLSEKLGVQFTIEPETIKYLGINLTKEVKDFYTENYKILVKQIEEDTSTQVNMPCSWIGKINIVRISILPKVI